MKWTCRKCWLLTLTRCDFLQPVTWRRTDRPLDTTAVEHRPGCYKSAIQHADDTDDSESVRHLCEDHASPITADATHTLLGLGRYRIPTKASWILLLLLVKFLLLPACGVELDILPFIEIKR